MGMRLVSDSHTAHRCLQIYQPRFHIWRGHIEKAVALGQNLQVFYMEGMVGNGKVSSWAACREDALRRKALAERRKQFLEEELSPEEMLRLDGLSAAPRDDSLGERPGSERADEEERLFTASLPEGDRAFLEQHKGLGNSQKAEVAWLDKQGYTYEELDVREFSAKRRQRQRL